MNRHEQRTAADSWRATKTKPVLSPYVDVTPSILPISGIVVAFILTGILGLISLVILVNSVLEWAAVTARSVSP